LISVFEFELIGWDNIC